MANPQIIIPGLSPSGKVPGAYVNVRVGQGRVPSSQIPRYLLIVGTKLDAGSATPNQDVLDITPASDLDALFGNRSQIARMIRVAQKRPGIRIKAAPLAEASGAVAATATITLTGSATSNGTYVYYVGGERVEVNIASGDNAEAQATKICQAFNASPFLPCTAAAADEVVTLTIANKGAEGNLWSIYQDMSKKPTGSSSALDSNNLDELKAGPAGETGKRFGGGTGTSSLTALRSVLQQDSYFTIATALNDTTSAASWAAYIDEKAALGSQRYEHLVLGHNDLESSADALSLALNNHRCQVVWLRGSENHPGELAAAMAALRHAKEQQHPNRRYDGDELLGLAPQRALLDRPSPGESGEQQLRLDAGVTPLSTSSDGRVVVVRSITTLSRRGGIPFSGCIDSGQARAPDLAAEEVTLGWLSEFSPNNEWVNADPGEGEKDRPSGVATPRIWRSYAQALLEAKIEKSWFSSVEVQTEYDRDNRQLLTQIAVEVTPQNHRVGVNVDQVNL